MVPPNDIYFGPRFTRPHRVDKDFIEKCKIILVACRKKNYYPTPTLQDFYKSNLFLKIAEYNIEE